FAPVVQLVSERMFELLEDLDQLIALAEFGVPIHETGQFLESGEVFLDLLGNVGALDLYGDGTAIVQGGEMHLPQGSGRQWLGIKVGESFVYPGAQFGFDDELNIGIGERLDLILKSGKRAQISGRQ